MKAIGEYFNIDRNTEIINTIKADGVYKTEIDGAEIELTMDDLLVTEKAKEGYIAETNYGVTVILNTTLNESLIERGSVREFISKVQNLRKSSGFEVTDHIEATALSDGYKSCHFVLVEIDLARIAIIILVIKIICAAFTLRNPFFLFSHCTAPFRDIPFRY